MASSHILLNWFFQTFFFLNCSLCDLLNYTSYIFPHLIYLSVSPLQLHYSSLFPYSFLNVFQLLSFWYSICQIFLSYFYLVLLLLLSCKIMHSLPIKQKLSESLSAPSTILKSKILLLNPVFISTWSIWFMCCPFGDFHVPLNIFLCRNMMFLILRFILVVRSVSLNPSLFLNLYKL